MFKQLHLNIILAEALVLMPKYQKMLKALLSNKEKLQELANTPLNENCSAVILKKLPEKLRDPGKFLIPYGFSLPDLIPTRMTLELANRAICTPDGITRDVFVPVERPLLRTARALIDVYGEEMILRDGDERLTLNMKHDTTSYSNHPRRESINFFNIFNLSREDCLEDLVSNKQTNSLLEEFADELALITYPPDYDDNRACDIESGIREIEFLLYQGEDSDFKDSIDQSDLANLDDLFVDPTLEMFTDEQPPDYSFPPRFDVHPDVFLEIESDANFDDDSFDSEGEKIKEAELLIDPLDLPCDILFEYDSFNSQNISRDDVLPSPDNEDKDFDPPFYELLVFKEVPKSMRLLPFSSENEEKVFKPGIYTFEKVHCFLSELSLPGFPVFKVNMIFLSLMKIFHVQKWKEYSSLLSSIPGFMKILANGFHYLKSLLSPLFNLGITYPDLID
nr:hypothetical protein [Tanacetum cinerariifolium]